MMGSSSLLRDYLGDRYVLVIEPAANYRHSLKRFLQNFKLTKQVRLASNVGEARREMLTHEIGLFIVEWKLPEKNGLQFCREIKTEAPYKNTPFLLLSVENLRDDVILASEVGIDGYLLKPFSFDEFQTQIDTIIRAIQNPTRINILLTQAQTLLNEAKYDEATELFHQARAENQDSARALCGLAKIQFIRQDFQSALQLYRDAIRIKPEYIEAQRGALEVHEALGDTNALLEQAMHLNDLSPGNPGYTLIIARCLAELNRLDDSEKFFRATIRLSPRLAEAYKGLGNVLYLKEDYEQAMKNFEKALDLDKRDISTLNSLGLALVRQGKIKEGIQKYKIALKLDAFDARVLFNLGYAYEKLGDMQNASYYYQQALVYQPDFDKAQRGIDRIKDPKAS